MTDYPAFPDGNVEQWYNPTGAVFDLLSFRVGSKWLNQQFHLSTHFSSHHLSSSSRMPHDNDSYDGTGRLGDTAFFERWDVSSIDNFLIQSHGPTETTEQVLLRASQHLDGAKLKKNMTWKFEPSAPHGGLSRTSLRLLSAPQIDAVYRAVIQNGDKLGACTNQTERRIYIENVLKNSHKPRVGKLERARQLFYYISTYTVAGVTKYTLCSIHLGKAQIALLCRATWKHPMYIRLEDTLEIRNLLQERATDLATQEARYRQTARSAAAVALTSSAARVPRRRGGTHTHLHWSSDDEYEEDDEREGGRSEGVESVPDDPTVIREPSEFHVPIYGGLMRYLFKICRAFVAAGEGNPCR